MMGKVRFETSDALGSITLANPPLNLFDQELIEDLRAAVGQARQYPLRALLVRADGKNFSGGADVTIFKNRTAAEARERFTSHLQTIADLEERDAMDVLHGNLDLGGGLQDSDPGRLPGRPGERESRGHRCRRGRSGNAHGRRQ